jgi:hypothetical protein
MWRFAPHETQKFKINFRAIAFGDSVTFEKIENKKETEKLKIRKRPKN